MRLHEGPTSSSMAIKEGYPEMAHYGDADTVHCNSIITSQEESCSCADSATTSAWQCPHAGSHGPRHEDCPRGRDSTWFLRPPLAWGGEDACPKSGYCGDCRCIGGRGGLPAEPGLPSHEGLSAVCALLRGELGCASPSVSDADDACKLCCPAAVLDAALGGLRRVPSLLSGTCNNALVSFD